jgi:hypothetical protein
MIKAQARNQNPPLMMVSSSVREIMQPNSWAGAVGR